MGGIRDDIIKSNSANRNSLWIFSIGEFFEKLIGSPDSWEHSRIIVVMDCFDVEAPPCEICSTGLRIFTRHLATAAHSSYTRHHELPFPLYRKRDFYFYNGDS